MDEQELAKLLALAAALPKSIDPPAEAWTEIRHAIEAERVSPLTPFTLRSAFWQRPIFLAAAALLLVASSSLVTSTLLRRNSAGAPTVAARPLPEAPSRAATAPASLAEFTVRENEYISEANQLSEILEAPDSKLSPETRAKLKESLRIIDAAILEARRALAADPANAAIVEMITGSYEQKIDLLRRSGEMARS